MGDFFQTPRLETLVTQVVDHRLILSHGGGFPARITAWDASTGRATVEAHFQLQPVGTRDDPSPAPESVTVANVRVMYPSAGGWIIRTAPQVGDLVWCMGAARSLEQLDSWQASRSAYVPSPPRVMSLDDVVALPLSWGSGATDSLILDGPGGTVELAADGRVLLNGGGAGVARLGDAVGITLDVTTLTALGAALVATGAVGVGTGTPVSPLPFSMSGEITSASDTVEAG